MAPSTKLYAHIAIAIPGHDAFEYLVPDSMCQEIQIGARVRVPLGTRHINGFCVKLSNNTSIADKKIRAIAAVLDKNPVADSTMIEFASWWAEYYLCSLGEALEASVPYLVGNTGSKQRMLVELGVLPDTKEKLALLEKKSPVQFRLIQFLKECPCALSSAEICRKLNISSSPINSLRQKGWLKFTPDTRSTDPLASLPAIDNKPAHLTGEQQQVITDLLPIVRQQQFATALLWGVTGSGKTEVYIRLIEAVVAQGREAILLVPEIALTPQTVMRFKSRFPHLALWHSELTPAQRARQWQEIAQGRIQVIIGARSALFAPTRNLGLIVVDEEHEPSFKQQNTPRYHARDLAVKRAQLAQALVILGSATPSMESYYNAVCGKYRLYRLSQRVGQAQMPQFTIIDMKEECREQKRFVYLSRFLMQKIHYCLEHQEQVIVFLNRRGFANTIVCPGCGYHAKCCNCDVALTYHRKSERSLCHYCGHDEPPLKQCPVCKLEGIRLLGAGTQRIEKILHQLFPQARIARMDSDTMTSRQLYEQSFLAFSRGEIDILLGTQMIAKGLDFPRVTLVGVITADVGLQLPDFRAAERTFQLLVQVAGRSGRGKHPGKVILQTFHPQHYAIEAAFAQDYEGFAAQELALRKELQYPPYGKLLRVIVEGNDENKVANYIQQLAENLQHQINKLPIELMGPVPAPIVKIKNRYRWHLIIKSQSFAAITTCAKKLQTLIKSRTAIRVHLDRDPVALL